jgi:hypothetical protein
LKQGAANFLSLVHQKYQHHEHREDDGEILLAMTEVVFEMIALILQRIEGFVLNLPSRTTTFYQNRSVLLRDRQIRHPGEVLATTSVRPQLAVHQKIDAKIRV